VASIDARKQPHSPKPALNANDSRRYGCIVTFQHTKTKAQIAYVEDGTIREAVFLAIGRLCARGCNPRDWKLVTVSNPNKTLRELRGRGERKKQRPDLYENRTALQIISGASKRP
jgi:hypothetical protein